FLRLVDPRRSTEAGRELDLSSDFSARIGGGVDVDVLPSQQQLAHERVGELSGARSTPPDSFRGRSGEGASEVVDDATVHADLTAVDVRASDPPGQTVDGDLVLQSFLGEGERSGAESGRSGRGIFLGPGQVRREVRAAGDVDLTADL